MTGRHTPMQSDSSDSGVVCGTAGAAIAIPLVILRSLESKGQFAKARSEIGKQLDLSERCKQLKALALAGQTAIRYPYLVDDHQSITADQAQEYGFSSEQIATLRSADQKRLEVILRVKGYLGWLITERVYLQERDGLISRASMLPKELHSKLSLTRSVRLASAPDDSVEAGASIANFQSALDQFLEKWSLTKLITWELPEPQGPFLGTSPPSGPAVPLNVVHIVLPPYYPLKGSDALLEEVRDQQLQLAREQNLPAGCASLRHHEAYGQIFEVAFWETQIRRTFQRFRIQGFTTSLETALAIYLGLGVNRIRKYRRAIEACRKGRRNSVTQLR